ncbi:F0F1 ATP synthase subunit epsilon [Cereibacter changlensis JA139]|uniref:ATP synthase epsilon chain n=2 Tax=Cereibacter changlensis TaxID=402884 RepID=A0A2T4JX51_9RHOB|nr:F0F1 ATP synthase subunit epsilon [Cereibacter changlensis]PTE22490.1 F0F1 ATP synthase subunit epsilon [Cereibacter changlensis JA139]PZX48768.1 F-type H+-transporting ATPase subunit epsilon [Cereibacter changlensis]
MTGSLSLRIMTPLVVVVDQTVTSLRAADASGSFGILPGHADFLTRLALSVISWTTSDGAAHFCAVRGGALTVRRGHVAVATREAVTGDDLGILDHDVLARFRSDLDEERVEHVEAARLQLDVMRRMLTRLQPRHRGAGL